MCTLFLDFPPSSTRSSQRDAAALKQFDKFLYLFLFVCEFTIGTGYNLDPRNATIFHDPKISNNSRGSYFGFSTALYVNVDRRESGSTIIVGAPRANSSHSVIESGAVYKCKINEKECKEWNLDRTENRPIIVNGSEFNQAKDNAWIGASIGIENNAISQPIAVVCAPRWINMMDPKTWDMYGMCYYSSIARNGETFEKEADRLIPLQMSRSDRRNRLNHHHLYQYSETGVSLHLHSHKNHAVIMLGNPGVMDWKGTPLLLESSNPPRTIIPRVSEGFLSKVPFELNDYFGYSVSSGFYLGRNGKRWYAAGAPRGGYEKRGGVLIFRFPSVTGDEFPESELLSGTQLGEYFGASLASCDVNNDGSDEIVVGAPFWTKEGDEGRVSVYTKNTKRYMKQNKFVELVRINGSSVGARFGSVVTCLGDLDNDGYGDIAVGAPYEGDHGAIYIYYGNEKGLHTERPQRIGGESIYKGIRGFGAAISEARDVDDNGYVDIAVGAYRSGQVILLRSLPVITIQLRMDTRVKLLNPDSPGFNVNVDLSYTGISVPDRIAFVATLRVDPRRASCEDKKYENGTYEKTHVLHKNEEFIGTNFFIIPVKSEKKSMEPLTVNISVHPVMSCARCFVINELASKVKDSLTLPFSTDCGDDNVCVSKLQISSLAFDGLENAINYTLGSKKTVDLFIGASNDGEPAHNAHVHIFIPNFISLYRLTDDCRDESRNADTREITCKLGDPLTGIKNITLEFQMVFENGVPNNIDSFVILANVSTSSNNDGLMRNLTINFVVDADLEISGESPKDNSSYLNKNQEILESITFQHIYKVHKLGPTPIKESVLSVSVPTHWEKKDKTSIEIATVNEPFVVMKGIKIDCTISSRINDKQVVNEAAISNDALIVENAVFEGITAADNLKPKFHPGSRPLYLNCTNLAIHCSEITCKLGNLEDNSTTAKLTITLDLHLRNLRPETLEAKDIVFFVSNGSVSITQPWSIAEHIESEHVRKLVGTRFFGPPKEAGVATWIIVVSILFGIILFVLLTLGLVKLGFFQRKKKEELDALRAQSTNSHRGFVLKTSSSDDNLYTEVL